MTYERKKYLIYGSKEIWLAEQKRLAKSSKYIYIKGHYRIYKNKKVWIKPYNRKRKIKKVIK